MTTFQRNQRAVRTLAAGAALLACPIAAAQAPLAVSRLNLVDTTSYIGSNNASLYAPLGGVGAYALGLYPNTGTFYALGTFFAQNDSGTDVFFTNYTSTAATAASGFLNVTVLTYQSVSFRDLGGSPGFFAATWTVDGLGAIADGDVLGAGTYTFRGTFSYSGASITTTNFGFGLTAAASAVPLPGAAGLAACGLVGLSRRRRRG